jgi:hypothetical protein
MKTLLVLVAVLGLGVAPALATDNVYVVNKKLSIGQFAGNCESMGGTFEGHGSGAGTCSKSGGYNVTCARDGGTTTCAGYDPNRPEAPRQE